MEEKISINVSGVNALQDTDDVSATDFVALSNIKSAFDRIGFDITVLDMNALVNLSYGQPHHHMYMPRSYNIFYTNINGSRFSDKDVELLNRAEEIWVSSKDGFDLIKDKVTPPVYLVPFGVSGYFMPTKRKVDKEFSFLYIDKYGNTNDIQNIVDIFMSEFSRHQGAKLIIKTRDDAELLVTDSKGNSVPPNAIHKNIEVITDVFYQDEYLRLLQTSTCLIYTSQKQEFKFVPLEALATGITVIAPTEWTDYADAITYPVSDLSKDNLRKIMLTAYQNKKNDAEDSFYKALKIHRDWNWNDNFLDVAMVRIDKIFKKLKKELVDV